MNTYISFLKIIRSEIRSLLRVPREVTVRLAIEAVLGSMEHLIYDVEELNKILGTSNKQIKEKIGSDKMETTGRYKIYFRLWPLPYYLAKDAKATFNRFVWMRKVWNEPWGNYIWKEI